jgi:tetratricopeptide (TPR) repeat protein
MRSTADNDSELLRAVSAHRAGQAADAEAHYRAFLRGHAHHAGANHNLGLLLNQRGETVAALTHLKTALDADPGQGQYWLSYAKALLAAGRNGEALDLLLQGRQRGLSGPAMESLLARAQEAPDQAGDAQAAIAHYRDIVAREPENAEAHFRLGSLLSENGAVAEGFAHYMRRAEMVWKNAPPLPEEQPEHRIKHDREQADYLAARGQSGFHLEDGARLAGPAVNPANATPDLFARWRDSDPQLVVIEDFLTPDALAKLRAYCAGSTIWRRNYDAGYIGGTPEDGLACPLMAQIAEEIRDRYAAILGGHRFRYLGAFKYDSTLSTGTNIHADNAAINVNFYIAPDEANLDPESGGMDVWNVSPESEQHMRRLNGDETAAKEFLARSRARLTRIPHRANRAVIFRSDLIHKTSDCRFAEGYLNKRINISLLYGDRPA